jgi:branched-chain amino acid transport system substrate-binding protein
VRRASLALAVIALLLAPRPVTAAEPFEINVILSMTGQGTFVGTGQWQSIQIAEGAINRHGGIAGRPVKFVLKDDQSNPQVDLQLVQGLIAQKVAVILGPTLTGSCNAVSPILQKDGPVSYCLTAGANPPKDGYVFSTLTSTPDLIAVAMRYFRERGWKKMAYLVATDASGQDAEQGILAAAALPENRGVTLAGREHFGTGDISVAAQLSKLKAAEPDVLLAWVTGAAAGTVLRGLHDAGMTLPTLVSSGNLTASFTKQFGTLLTDNMYVPAMAFYGGTAGTERRTRDAMNLLATSFRAAAAAPDQVAISAWDPTMVLVDALRAVGVDAPASKVRDYMVSSQRFTGVNGPYDFRSIPQRGIGQSAVLMVRWDSARGEFRPLSGLGGEPVRSR